MGTFLLLFCLAALFLQYFEARLDRVAVRSAKNDIQNPGRARALAQRIVAKPFFIPVKSYSIFPPADYANLETDAVAAGTLGWPEEAPFDRIIVTAAAPGIPQSLTTQLADEGILVMPVGPVGMQTLMVMRRHAGKTRSESVCDCVFVRLIGEEGYAEGYKSLS